MRLYQLRCVTLYQKSQISKNISVSLLYVSMFVTIFFVIKSHSIICA